MFVENIPFIKTLSFFDKMFVKSEHYNARKEVTLNDEGQVISTKVKGIVNIVVGVPVTMPAT